MRESYKILMCFEGLEYQIAVFSKQSPKANPVFSSRIEILIADVGRQDQ
jgi:hypothetical protein